MKGPMQAKRRLVCEGCTAEIMNGMEKVNKEQPFLSETNKRRNCFVQYVVKMRCLPEDILDGKR